MHATVVTKVLRKNEAFNSTIYRTVAALAVGILSTLVSASAVKAQHAPVANTSAGAPYRTDLGLGITVNGSASSDPDGDITNYNWDFLNNGTTDITGAIASPTWANLNTYGITGVGTYPLKLTVIDATLYRRLR